MADEGELVLGAPDGSVAGDIESRHPSGVLEVDDEARYDAATTKGNVGRVDRRRPGRPDSSVLRRPRADRLDRSLAPALGRPAAPEVSDRVRPPAAPRDRCCAKRRCDSAVRSCRSGALALLAPAARSPVAAPPRPLAPSSRGTGGSAGYATCWRAVPVNPRPTTGSGPRRCGALTARGTHRREGSSAPIRRRRRRSPRSAAAGRRC